MTRRRGDDSDERSGDPAEPPTPRILESRWFNWVRLVFFSFLFVTFIVSNERLGLTIAGCGLSAALAIHAAVKLVRLRRRSSQAANADGPMA